MTVYNDTISLFFIEYVYYISRNDNDYCSLYTVESYMFSSYPYS
jgi:hypothetical protein